MSAQRKIKRAWSELKKEIQNFSNRYTQSSRITFPDLAIDVVAGSDVIEVQLNTPIWFSEWPERNSSKKKCNIFISGKYTCRNNGGGILELLHYGTRIAYFRPESHVLANELRWVDGYHFDMEAKLQRAHPVFHAQRSHGLLSDEVAEKYAGKITVKQADPHGEGMQNIRLPTPQFDIHSAMLLMLADHVVHGDDECENEFMSLVSKVTQLNPVRVNLQNQGHLNQCINNGGEIMIGHWYAMAAPS